ncbi:phosphopantothenoylcysteine decarboxylase, partial [Burkholderia multivorans]
ALARAAHAAGAKVELVAAHVDTGLLSDLPADITITPIESTLDLQDAMETAQTSVDVIIMAAAVADYRPAEVGESKLKKSGDEGMRIDLVQNPDVLAGLNASRRPGKFIVGFAAETGDATHTAHEYA